MGMHRCCCCMSSMYTCALGTRLQPFTGGCQRACACAGAATHARTGARVLLPDSWAVHLWDMAIRWLAVYYFITARARRPAACRRV